jgi:RNA recognition motif-containing protein
VSINDASTAYKRIGIKQMKPAVSHPKGPPFPILGYQFLPVVPHQQLFFPFGYIPQHQPVHRDIEEQEPILSSTNLYIRGLPESCTDEDLTKMCLKYGNIASTKSILDKKTLLCKGYGFVDFEDPQDAQRALEGLTDDGVSVQFARLQEQDPTNLYLSNLPKSFNEKNLEQLLSPFGGVISTRILREPNGYSRGVGFVRLDNQENCETAISTLNGSTLPGAPEPLNIKFADSGNYKRKSPGHYAPTSFTDLYSANQLIRPNPPPLWKDTQPTEYIPPPAQPPFMAPTHSHWHHLPPSPNNPPPPPPHPTDISNLMSQLHVSPGPHPPPPPHSNNGAIGHTPTFTAHYTHQPPGWTITQQPTQHS